MRILILGAGGIGGYFGGRLAAAGVDTTFLVRPRRAAQLARDGLVIRSPVGDLQLAVNTVQRETAGPGYDAILLSCKAYDLADTIDSIRPAAPGALVIPMLNGMRHLDTLDAAFGADHVAGGVAMIGVDMEPDGTIRHLASGAGLVFGERGPAQAAVCAALAPIFAGSGFEGRRSAQIVQEMWEKFVFITANAGMCCLMRGNIGEIARTQEGAGLMGDLLAECAATATSAGHPPRDGSIDRARRQLTDPRSTTTASMLRDLRRGGKVEGDHVIGDMLTRAIAAGVATPVLRAIFTNLEVYEAQRGVAAQI